MKQSPGTKRISTRTVVIGGLTVAGDSPFADYGSPVVSQVSSGSWSSASSCTA